MLIGRRGQELFSPMGKERIKSHRRNKGGIPSEWCIEFSSAVVVKCLPSPPPLSKWRNEANTFALCRTEDEYVVNFE